MHAVASDSDEKTDEEYFEGLPPLPSAIASAEPEPMETRELFTADVDGEHVADALDELVSQWNASVEVDTGDGESGDDAEMTPERLRKEPAVKVKVSPTGELPLCMLRGFVGRLPRLAEILRNGDGTETDAAPTGVARVQALILVRNLICTRHPVLVNSIPPGVMGLAMGLFFARPNANIVHSAFSAMALAVLDTEREDKDTFARLRSELLSPGGRFVERLVDVCERNAAAASIGVREAITGHAFNLVDMVAKTTGEKKLKDAKWLATLREQYAGRLGPEPPAKPAPVAAGGSNADALASLTPSQMQQLQQLLAMSMQLKEK